MPDGIELALQNLRAQQASPVTDEQLSAADPGESLAVKLALLPVRAVGAIFDGIDFIDSLSRAAVGRAIGVEGSGRDTLLGPAPTGREIAEKFTGKLPDEYGLDYGDVIGFGTELAVSPLNLVGVGELTSGGKLAARIAKLETRVNAFTKAGRAADIADEAALLAKLKGEYSALGQTAEYGKTLAEQGQLGQRNLLSIGDLSLLPRGVNQAGLAALGAVGRGIKATGITKLFETGTGIKELDPFLDVAKETRRATVFAGEQEAKLARSNLDKVAAKLDQPFLDNLAKVINPAAEEAADPLATGASQSFLQRLNPLYGVKDAKGVIYAAAERIGKTARIPEKIADANNAVTEYVSQRFAAELQGAKDSAEKLAAAQNVKAPFQMSPAEYAEYVKTVRSAQTPPPPPTFVATPKGGAARKVGRGVVLEASQQAAEKVAGTGGAVRVYRPKFRRLLEASSDEQLRLALGVQKGADRTDLVNYAFANGYDGVRVGGQLIASPRALQKSLAVKVLPTHRQVVEQAIERGRPVPDAAVSAYPELVAKREAARQAKAIQKVEASARVERARAKAGQKIYELRKQGELNEAFLARLPQELRAEAERISTVSEGLRLSNQAAGAQAPELGGTLSYLHRTINPEALDLIEKLDPQSPFRALKREYDATGSYAKARTIFPDVPVPGVNQAYRDALAAKGIKFDGDLFSTDVSESLLERFKQGGKAEGDARLFTGAISNFAIPRSAAGPDAVATEKVLKLSRLSHIDGIPLTEGSIAKQLAGTALEGTAIPRNIADALLKTQQTLTKPEDVNSIVKLLNTFNSFARIGVTTLAPGYYARNATGNLFNMFLAGFRDPRYIAKANELLARLEAGTASEAEKNLVKLIYSRGAFDSGNIAEVLGIGAESGVDKILSKVPALEKGKNTLLGVNRRIENLSKLALFYDGVGRGLTHREAADRVVKYLFDYSDLSRFEKAHLRKYAFFYTYVRKNIPLQLEAIFRNPVTARAYGLLTGRLGESYQKETLPLWMRNRGLILDPRGPDESGNARFLEFGLPIEDAFRFDDEGGGVQRALQKVGAQLAPTYRAPIEAAAGVNLGTGLPISVNPRESQALQSLPGFLQPDAASALRLATYSPGSRLLGLGEKLALTGDREGADFSALGPYGLGVGFVSSAERKLKLQQQREQARQILSRLQFIGVPRTDERVRAANRALAVK